MKATEPKSELGNDDKSDHPLWDSLTSEQQRGVLEAYDESENERNLISLLEIKAKFGE